MTAEWWCRRCGRLMHRVDGTYRCPHCDDHTEVAAQPEETS